MTSPVPPGTPPALEVRAALLPRFDEILTPDALDFVAELTRLAAGRRDELLRARAARYASGDPAAEARLISAVRLSSG